MQPDNLPPNNPLPNQPAPGNLDSSQFDFILNPQTPPKKSLLPNDPKIKMAIFALGILVIVGILLVVIFSIFNSGDSSTESLVKIARQQNEIIRVANDGTRKASSESTKKLASLTYLTTTTDQKNLSEYLSKQNKKLNPKELKSSSSADTDKTLANASSNGRYDEEFTKTLTELLKEYQSSLQSTYDSLGPKAKEVTKQSFDNVTLIIKDTTGSTP